MYELELKNLRYEYGTGTPFHKVAIQDVNLRFEEGEFIGIIGHTGSGKSTLVQHLNGLLKPTAGEVLLGGVSIWQDAKRIKEVRGRVGLVFQYPEYQLFEETVARDIAFGPKNKGIEGEALDQAVRTALDFVGLPEEVLEKSPFELSGGQKRRVAIAGVIAMAPQVLILDEPTAGLDPHGRDEILSRIRVYHEKTGATILLVSHSMEDIARFADKALVMNHSRVEMFDTVENIFKKADRLCEIGLAVPQITRVFLRLRELGISVDASVYTVEDAVKEIRERLRAGGGSHA